MRNMMLAMVWLLPAAALAESATEASTREVMAYRFTESGLARYAQGLKNLSGVKLNCDRSTSSLVIDDAVRRLDSQPGVKSAIQSAGMSTREYVLFSWAIPYNMIAATGAKEGGGAAPAGAQQANVDFFRQHEAKFRELTTQASRLSCE